MQRLPLLLNLGCPILVGVSRKALHRQADPASPSAGGSAMPGSLAGALYARARVRASILRVHDVAGTVQALRVWGALMT